MGIQVLLRQKRYGYRLVRAGAASLSRLKATAIMLTAILQHVFSTMH